jgi:hypothetical protein
MPRRPKAPPDTREADEPIDDDVEAASAEGPRCKAKSRRSGEQCRNAPVRGWSVCRMHGAGNGKDRAGGRKPVHGKYAMRHRGLTQEAAERLDELMQDPDLLDMRRTVASSQLVVEQVPILPPDELVDELARRIAVEHGRAPEGVTDAHRDEARRRLAAANVKILERHGKLQGVARRQTVEADLLLAKALPVMQQFAESLVAIVRPYLTPQELAQVQRDMVAAIDTHRRSLVAVAVDG